ncbi:hypothetical protein ALP36_03224 [Pseudomonas syringae pv. coriandricola]|uniref:Uncharacterized protein n=2 Tax=Pseudomonas syringae group genomosp. 3 TaxID=251701 RepID=A0A3M5R3F8_9PSED|nr:hypothetical protein ALP87_00967 [Pseudomonas syringae pv. coriandricola]RMU03579.1 hypothetical protein ALP36_03224 [Pseudomonas syringae pv. coriandricola]
MNDLKNTTMLWKRMNYSAQRGKVKNTPGLSQLKSSLDHSLRLVMKKELEFNLDLSDRNFILQNNKLVRLDSLTLEDRQAIVDEIMKSVQNDLDIHRDLLKLKDDRSKYAHKLKKLLIKKDEPEVIKTLIKRILEAHNSELLPSLIDEVDFIGVRRANDKKNAIGRYVELHNKIIAVGNNSLHKSKTVVQECFFKFPARNNIDEIKPVDYVRIIYDFHKRYLSDYEIKACVFHGDEVSSLEQIDNGVHPHIFISGKNSKTGQYDLVQAQLDLVNRYLKSKGEPAKANNSFKASQTIGESYQRLVYEYVNKRLSNFGYGIEASIHEKTEAHKKKLELIAEDAHKAKIMRGFNLLSMSKSELEKAEQQKNILTTQQDRLRKNISSGDRLRSRLVKKNKLLAEQTNLIILNNLALEKEFNDTKAAIEALNNQKLILERENNSLLENIQANGKALANQVWAVEKSIALLAHTASEQLDMRRVFAEFKSENFRMLSSLSPSDRVYYMYNMRERLVRECLDIPNDKIHTKTDRFKLHILDACNSLKKLVSKRKSEARLPKL